MKIINSNNCIKAYVYYDHFKMLRIKFCKPEFGIAHDPYSAGCLFQYFHKLEIPYGTYKVALLEIVNKPIYISDSDYLLLNIYRSVYDDNESRVVVEINSSIKNSKRSQTSVCDIEDKEKLNKLIPKGNDRNFIIKTIY